MIGVGLSIGELATRQRSAAAPASPPLRLATNRNRISTSERVTAATTVVQEFRDRRRAANSIGRNWRIAVPNFWITGASAGDALWSNNWTGYAEYEVGGVVYPVTFSAANTFTMGPSQTTWLISDPVVGLVTTPNAIVYVKGGVRAVAGQRLPTGALDFNGSSGSINAEQAIHDASSFVRQGVAGAFPAAAPVSNYGNATAVSKVASGGPCFITLCEYDTPQPAVVIVGDSKVQGQEDGQPAGSAQGEDRGPWAQGCVDVLGAGTRIVPYISVGRPGETLATFATAAKSQYRRLAYAYATHAIHEHLVNDITGTYASQAAADTVGGIAKTNLQIGWAWAKAAGLKVWHGLLTPATLDDAVNFFKTPTVAEKNNGIATYGLRKMLNAWIIGRVGYDIDGVIDLNSALEYNYSASQWTSGTPSNQWATDGATNDLNTNDGVHESSQGSKNGAVVVRGVTSGFTG